jgi:dTDP-4-amino-4,6-dideoxygalactose transaminase
MDTDPATFSTTAEEIARRLTPATAAVVIVHVGGIVTDRMPQIQALTQARGIALVEDAAHGHGSRLDGTAAGCFGVAGSFSFYPTKVMTSAEGGMIVTDDEAIAAEARIYRDQGKASFTQNAHVRMGYNWRMSEPHAIIGLRHLTHLPAMIGARQRTAARYDEGLADLDGLRPLAIPPGCACNYYKYIAMLPDGVDRAALKRTLKESHGVILGGEVYELPLHKNPIFVELDTSDLGESERVCARHVCLPMFASMTEAQAERVVAALRAELCA